MTIAHTHIYYIYIYIFVYAKKRCHNKELLNLHQSAHFGQPLWSHPVLNDVVLASVQSRTCSIYLFCLVDKMNCLAKRDGFYSYLSAIYNLILREYSRKHGRLSFVDCLSTGVGASRVQNSTAAPGTEARLTFLFLRHEQLLCSWFLTNRYICSDICLRPKNTFAIIKF